MVVAVGVESCSRLQISGHKNKEVESSESNHEQENETVSKGSKRRIEVVAADDNNLNKKANKGKELTMQDMYTNDGDLDDDEEEDSDWDPCSSSTPPRLMTWFCLNCTMPNIGDVEHCDTCGEHKHSGILRLGCFSSPSVRDFVDFNTIEMGNHKGAVSQPHFDSSATAIGYDGRMLLHQEVGVKPHPHPERPDRLQAINASLGAAGIYPGKCCHIPAREITKEELLQVHSHENIEAVELTRHAISSYFTSDTYANESSSLAARLAAGLCADLATSIFSEKVKNGFALVRPPGHHAGVSHSMGFCLHNNAAIAAAAAQDAGAKKVLILDWDVHHGNGTQEIFEQNKSVLYISLHRHEKGKFYPGTGAASEVGSSGGEGFCVNIPWNRGGVGDKDYIFAFEHVVMPIATEFAPDFVIVSAGFDAARGDPLGCCDVTPTGYAQMTHMLNALAGGKLLVLLEGGYNLRSISSSATTVIKVLLGESPETEWQTGAPSKSGLLTVLEVLQIQKSFWPILEPVLIQLQSEWSYIIEKTIAAGLYPRKEKIVNPRLHLPPWWRWGRKCLMYRLLQRRGHGSSGLVRRIQHDWSL